MIDDMQVYIANLGKYNEGKLVGGWFSFPLDEEVIAERIGLNAEYEEYAIHDTDNFPMVGRMTGLPAGRLGQFRILLWKSGRTGGA